METIVAKPSPTRGRPRSFDRDRALERAMLLFWRHGFAATSIADLTRAMGISAPSLYAAFGDKERLFLEAVERYRHVAGVATERILAAAPTARLAVERLLDSAARQLTCPDHPRGCMMVTAAMNCSGACHHLQEALARQRTASTRLLQERIDRGIAAGELPPSTDAAALAAFYQTVLQGMTIQACDGADSESLRATAAAAMRAWPVAADPVRKGEAGRQSGSGLARRGS
jgi:AcrR family transcriptional regulator